LPLPTPEQIEQARLELIEQAVRPFDQPQLRQTLVTIQQRNEQIIDTVSVDRVREAGFSAADTERARATVESFRQFLAEHHDEITALQIIYGQPYAQRALTFQQVKELAEHLSQPPHTWSTEALWQAYAQLEKDKVHGVSARRVLTDVVSLARHAVQLDDELVPYPERVRVRYTDWLAAQEASGHSFTAEQRWWLDKIAEHIGVSVCIAPDDFDVGEFFNRGGRIAAARLFGKTLPALLDELNTALA
jgi:type I restriction enzyme R subunit